MTITEWIAQAIDASYPLGQRWEATQAAIAFLDWLDSLPDTDERTDNG